MAMGDITDGLLVKTELKQSNIPQAGRGRFFLENYEQGTIVREQCIDTDLHVFTCVQDIKTTNEEHICNFAHTRCADTDVNCEHVYLNKEPLYTNHSSNHNIAFKFIGNKKITFTSRDVEAGEEMLQNYNHYTKVDWYEQYLHSINRKSLREFALSLGV